MSSNDTSQGLRGWEIALPETDLSILTESKPISQQYALAAKVNSFLDGMNCSRARRL